MDFAIGEGTIDQEGLIMSDSTRRDFLKVSAGVIAGASVASGLSILGKNAEANTAVHPYGYTPLDVETTRQLGYNGYKGIVLSDGKTHGECAFATFNAIVSQLAAADPTGPYANIPLQMMEWGAGGVVGFATFCGTLNGACASIGLICDKASAAGFISDLLSWYSETLLPTNIIAPTGALPQSIATGNLCHMSVTNWCLASGYASGSPERGERCARLAGDVAAKAVEMLNNGRLGLTVPGDKTVCRTCHYKGTDYAAGQFTRGKMGCTTCHTDLKQVPASGHRHRRHHD